jgi:hypothetical protein
MPAYGRHRMWPLAEMVVGLIALVALDDVLEGRASRRTWKTAASLISGVGAIMAGAVALGSAL